MAELTFFTLTGVISAVNGGRENIDDPELLLAWGSGSITPMIDDGNGIPVGSLVPPQNVHLQPVKFIVKRGRIMLPTGQPVRLVANTTMLGLDGDLYYRATFSSLMAAGDAFTQRPIVFKAQTSDTTLDLESVTPVTGSPALGLTRGPGVDNVLRVGTDPDMFQFYSEGHPVGAPLQMAVELGQPGPPGDPGPPGSSSWNDLTDMPDFIAAGVTQQAARDAIAAQPYDADLVDIAALTPTDQDILQRRSGAWRNRTMAQLKLDLALVPSDVGLGNVNNTSDLNKPISTATQAALNAKQSTSEKNQANGYAGLDASGYVPAALLPSYVDDVLEFANVAAFPAAGEAGKIYTALNAGTPADPSRIYRWTGTTYVEISPSPGSTDAVAEGATNLYYTNARADARITAARGVTLQPYDADLAAIAALASAADKMPYATGPNAWALATLTPFARTILDDPDATSVLNTLGVVSGNAPLVQEYTTATGGVTGAARPAGAKGVLIKKMIGAGGAGGSGAFNSGTGTNRPGGGGGAGGNVVEEHWVPVAQLGTTFDVQVGAKGVGGAAVTTTSNGNAGTAGGDAVFTSGSFTLRASGGGAGAGGTGSTAPGGTPGPYGDKLGTPGAASSTSSVPTAALYSPTLNAGVRGYGGGAGGGGGSGISSAGTANTTAGAGGSTPTAAGGTGGTAAGAAPTANGPLLAGEPGAGGGGGALNPSNGVGQAGANGVGYGAGGGGGGGAGGSGGVTSGKGGDGGPSYVLLIWYF